MWIDAVCGLLIVAHVYLQVDKHIAGERSVPELATFFTLVNSFGRFKS